MHRARLVALSPALYARTAAAAELAAVDGLGECSARVDAGLQHPPRLLEERREGVVRKPAEGRPRIDAQRIQRLAADDVADARGDRLVEQHLADRTRGRRALPRTRDRERDLRILVEEIGSECAQRGVEGKPRAVEQLEHGAAELHCAHPAGAQDEPRRGLAPPPALAGAVDMPRARHAQVGVEAAAVVELQQQVLAPRAHRHENATIERGRQTDRRPRGGRACGNPLTDEGRQAQRGDVQRVALGQG